MAVRLHVAPHPDHLVSLLCDLLAVPPADPFAPELVAVPTRGIERWLTQEVASGLAERGVGDGICANVEFPSPGDLVRRVLLAVPDLAAAVTVWEGPGLTAHLLDTIDHHLAEPWMGLLARYLDNGEGDDLSPSRLAAAAKIARLFTRYARRRPGMIRDWRLGEDHGPDGEPLTDEYRWQPRLWRELRDRLAVASLPELLPGALDPVRLGDIEIELPDRVAVYGLTATDPLDLEVLGALAVQRHVHLYVLHPSPALWASEIDTAALPIRRHDPSISAAIHPLLKAWGRDSRELQTVLAAAGLGGGGIVASAPAPATLLGRLQDDIRRNVAPEPGMSLMTTDRSVQIHLCHGIRRQTEVLRDAILHLLVSDPTLEPRDIVIMTPDLATFAPLLEAAFPQSEGSGLPDLRLRIADRSPAVRNPLVVFAANLLTMAGSRFEADTVRQLVGRPVVQNKFGFDSDTAGAIVSLIDDVKVAWGLDAAHRRQWGVDSSAERTWRRGLDRALSGIFYSDSAVRTVGGISPLHGVEGQDTVPAGVLATVLDRLAAVRALVTEPMPWSEWAAAVAESVRMLATPAWGDEWQLDQLERLLGETFPAPEAGGADPVVSLGEARSALTAWTDDRPSPLHFRTGDITLCTLAPMRSVPYRVVCLLGMDEARFPRRGRLDGDDLLGDHELVGDRDVAAMDRQLLLDAIMAAGDHLVATYSGRDELTNATIPPAVPVAELVDIVADMVGEEALEERIITRHPLQSFSEDNFISGRLGMAGAWSFDPDQVEGAVSLQRRSAPAAPSPPDWPLPNEDEAIRLSDLIAFLQNPVRRFVRSRLGFTIPDPSEIPEDTLPSDLGPLDKWSVTDRVLTGLLAGHDPAALVRRERGNDALPPGDLGGDDLEAAVEAATTLWEAASLNGYDPRRHQPFAGVVVGSGRPVEGTVIADPERGHLPSVTPSKLKGKQRLDAFTKLVFLSALRPEVAWKAILLGRRDGTEGHLAVTVGPLAGDADKRRQRAVELLSGLVDLYAEGMRRPLPLPCETAYTWQRQGGVKEMKARYRASDQFSGRFGEAGDRAHALMFPSITSFEALEATGFSDYCARLWLPILPLIREKNI